MKVVAVCATQFCAEELPPKVFQVVLRAVKESEELTWKLLLLKSKGRLP